MSDVTRILNRVQQGDPNAAQELLPLVEISPQIRWFIALICIDAGASGHRADIVVSNAARTLRATVSPSIIRVSR